MSRASFAAVSVALFSIVIASVSGSFRAGGAEPKGVVSVTADDLDSRKVIVIGRLGIPLETMATLRGTWRHPDGVAVKDYALVLHVTHVDGKALSEPVEFHKAIVEVTYPRPRFGEDKIRKQPKPADGATWEIRGYETGGFRGHPAQFEKEARLGPKTRGVWDRSFLTELVGILPNVEEPAKNLARGGTGQTRAKNP